MPDTLLVDTNFWDLLVDARGDIALASEPYALAQDAASAVKTFAGELWYDTVPGVPYFDAVLGHYPPLNLIKFYLRREALRTPNLVNAQAFLSDYRDRHLTGQLQVTDRSGNITVIGF